MLRDSDSLPCLICDISDGIEMAISHMVTVQITVNSMIWDEPKHTHSQPNMYSIEMIAMGFGLGAHNVVTNRKLYTIVSSTFSVPRYVDIEVILLYSDRLARISFVDAFIFGNVR